MKEAHRSASPSRERFDHPHRPPLVLNADARKSVNCDEPNRNRRTTIAIHLTSDAAALTSHRKPGCAGGRASAETDFAARITSPNRIASHRIASHRIASRHAGGKPGVAGGPQSDVAARAANNATAIGG